jgi:deoxycytidine triphosphate deaminase
VTEQYFIKKHEFVVAHTFELVKLPNDLAGLVEGKSRSTLASARQRSRWSRTTMARLP